MPEYEFTVCLKGTGENHDQAWEDAAEAFSLDPGDPHSVAIVEGGKCVVQEGEDQPNELFQSPPAFVSRVPAQVRGAIDFEFFVRIRGVGEDDGHAWADATSAFPSDWGDPECSRHLTSVAVNADA